MSKAAQNEEICERYERFYAERNHQKLYPTEFVVRTFLAQYPNLNFDSPKTGSKILDVGFGDGRNTALLCDLGLQVFGIEISQGIVDQTSARLADLGYSCVLRVGWNSDIPFEDNEFDYILACHSCYYCQDGETFLDNLTEYSRVLKRDGYLVASVPNTKSYIFSGSQLLPDGSAIILNDPYKNRENYRLHGFKRASDVEVYFGSLFKNFSIGTANNDYYGIDEKVFWVVCQKRNYSSIVA